MPSSAGCTVAAAEKPIIQPERLSDDQDVLSASCIGQRTKLLLSKRQLSYQFTICYSNWPLARSATPGDLKGCIPSRTQDDNKHHNVSGCHHNLKFKRLYIKRSFEVQESVLPVSPHITVRTGVSKNNRHVPYYQHLFCSYFCLTSQSASQQALR